MLITKIVVTVGGVHRWQRPVKGRAFNTWVDYVEWRRSMRALLRKAVPRMNSVLKSSAYRAWRDVTFRSRREHLQDNVEDNTVCLLLPLATTRKRQSFILVCNGMFPILAHLACDMQTQIEALKAENDRLRRDNERFVRIIDSGEWGRGRVAELVQVRFQLLLPNRLVFSC